MHIAEGLLPAPHAGAWFGVAALCAAAGARRAAPVDDPAERRALLTLAGALTFAATVLPVPVPGVGLTSHVCATPLFALLLGARALVVPAALVLAVQAAFLAHGGLTTLGANVVTLGVVGPAVAVAAARALRRLGLGPRPAAALACGAASLAVYAAAATILAAALPGDRSLGADVGALLVALAPVQVPLALVEGALSAVV
ncbi:MAG: energy-coupling factor ABC transporter permease, partial [Planctomycetes bacterium]|nr:energy-coupling factor ABC transporter permease [Planctomycetota bacterium]